jgi:arylsulfatase A-like enzyme
MEVITNGRFNRRDFLKVTGIAACSAMGTGMFSCISTKQEKKPNVILIMTDDQGYGDLSCHGSNDVSTPALDRLYSESVRLTDFHVSPTCAPTRASLLTGRYCNDTGVWHTVMGRSLLRSDELTLADVFTSHGYITGIFGKWHLGDNYPYRPQDRGFQEVVIHGGGGVGQTPDYWGNDYQDDSYWVNGKPEKFEGYCTDVWFNQAMEFIEKNKEKPFFCYIPTNAPHGPFIAPEPYEGFFGMIKNIDDNMDRLLNRLDQLQLTENTILIFMTDNGTAAGSLAGMRGKKSSPYDGGHRVPFFIRWPNGDLVGGKDVKELTAHIDVLPTLVDLCGLKKPDGPVIHGKSLVPLLYSKEAWKERTIVVDSQRIEYPEKWRSSAVMTNQWRLVNGKELYDIKVDPGQEKDISVQNPDIVKELRAEYEKWWQQTSSRFDEYCTIVLGSDKANPVTLTCHDWHGGGGIPWNQQYIRQGLQTNGFWAVKIVNAGTYQFEFRR